MRFGDLYEIPSRNGLTKPRAIRGEGIKFINMGELFENDCIGDIEMDRAPVTEKEFVEALVEEGDLLFARQSLVREGAGKCSIVTEVKEPTTFDSHLIRVRLKRELANPNFYRFYFSSHLSPIPGIVSQCAQAGIKGNDLKELDVIYPPIQQQDRIAEILSAYDELIFNNRKQIKLLEEAAQRLYKEWFVDLRFPGHETVSIDPATNLPEGWNKGSLSDVVDFKRGKTITAAQTEKGSVPVVAGGLGPAYYHSRSNATGPVVTVSGSGANAGFTRLYTMDIWASDCSYVDSTMTDVLAFVYESVNCIGKGFKHLQRGSAQPHVYPSHINGMEMLIPPTRMQEAFCEFVDPIISKISLLDRQMESSREARDRLLPKLMSGEIEVS